MTVLVTGGTTRLGKVIADRLRELGHRVVVTSHRAEAVAFLLAAKSTSGVIVPVDGGQHLVA